MSVQIFCLLFKSNVFLLFIKLWESFIYSGNRSITRCAFYKYSLPVCGLSFHFLKLSFEEQNFEVLMMSNLSDFFFLVEFMHFVSYLKSLPYVRSHVFSVFSQEFYSFSSLFRLVL